MRKISEIQGVLTAFLHQVKGFYGRLDFTPCLCYYGIIELKAGTMTVPRFANLAVAPEQKQISKHVSTVEVTMVATLGKCIRASGMVDMSVQRPS